MKRGKKVTRDTIIQTLIKTLKPRSYVHAFWEGGAIAFNRIDKWSDIDLCVVVDDEKVDETFTVVENALNSLSPIKLKFPVPQLPWPGTSQAFYKLENTSEYLIIDFAVFKLSAPEKLLEAEIHGNLAFYFNKSNKIKRPKLDRNSFLKKLRTRLERLQLRINMFNNFVEKELSRDNVLEAIEWYHAFTLASLVEALRIKNSPIHYDFRMRYVHYELPAETIKKLEHLYFIKDKKDLQEKYGKATRWFQKTMLEINPKEVERKIKAS